MTSSGVRRYNGYGRGRFSVCLFPSPSPPFPMPGAQNRQGRNGLGQPSALPGEIPVAHLPLYLRGHTLPRIPRDRRFPPRFAFQRFPVRLRDGASQSGRHCKAVGGEICSLPASPGWFNQRSREWSRKMNKWFVYCHTFPNGKKYIGITSQNPYRRWENNGTGYKNQGLIWNAIQKYGWENVTHEIIFEVDDLKSAEYYEEYYITIYQSDNRKYGYNIKGGGRLAKGYKQRPEVVQKMAAARIGEKNWIYGKHLSAETKKKLSIAHKGKCDIEAIRKAAKKRMGGKAYNARKVACFTREGEYIKSFDSLADAGREYGIRPQDIYNCCNGRQLTTHGKRWKYAE